MLIGLHFFVLKGGTLQGFISDRKEVTGKSIGVSSQSASVHQVPCWIQSFSK